MQTYDSSTLSFNHCNTSHYLFSYFIRPGAGKSTTADKVVGFLNDKGYRSAASSIRQCDDTKHHEYLALDLDVCVSQTMRVSELCFIYELYITIECIYSKSLSNHNTN